MTEQEIRAARASIAGVWLARLGCVGFGVYYLAKLDLYGVGLMAALFWGAGWLLPVLPKK